MQVLPKAIIEEAERRGWPVYHLSGARQFYRVDHPDGRQMWFKGTLPHSSSFIGNRLTLNKWWTFRFLESLGYRLPAALLLKDEQQAMHFMSCHPSITVKPAYGERGLGVTVDVRTRGSLRSAIRTARSAGKAIILQETLAGEEYRLLVVGGRFFAAARRLPVTVRGNGRSSLRRLLEQAKIRENGRSASLPPLNELNRLAEELNRVPATGEIVTFSSLRSRSLGGETEDITDTVHATYRQAVEDIAQKLQLTLCGFDFMTADITASCPSTLPLLELNSEPGFGPHLYPTKGLARNPAVALLDHIFAAKA